MKTPQEILIDMLVGTLEIRRKALKELMGCTPNQRQVLMKYCQGTENEHLTHVRKLQNSIKRVEKLIVTVKSRGVKDEKVFDFFAMGTDSILAELKKPSSKIIARLIHHN